MQQTRCAKSIPRGMNYTVNPQWLERMAIYDSQLG